MQNTYIPKFTYIIPFRFRIDRIIPLRRVIDWLSGYQGVEIIIVEQDTHSKISHMDLKAQKVFIESSAPFNKSWAFNVGLKRALSPVVICGDADTLMNPMELIEALKQLDSCDCIIPISNIVNLDFQESMADASMILNIKRVGKKKNLTDGVVIFKKSALLRINGWNEDFFGVGGESSFQDLKVTKLLNWRQLDYSGYHLYHNSDSPDLSIQQRTDKIMSHYNNADANTLQQHINSTFGKIGLLNKYQI